MIAKAIDAKRRRSPLWKRGAGSAHAKDWTCETIDASCRVWESAAAGADTWGAFPWTARVVRKSQTLGTNVAIEALARTADEGIDQAERMMEMAL